MSYCFALLPCKRPYELLVQRKFTNEGDSTFLLLVIAMHSIDGRGKWGDWRGFWGLRGARGGGEVLQSAMLCSALVSLEEHYTLVAK